LTEPSLVSRAVALPAEAIDRFTREHGSEIHQVCKQGNIFKSLFIVAFFCELRCSFGEPMFDNGADLGLFSQRVRSRHNRQKKRRRKKRRLSLSKPGTVCLSV